MVSTNITKSLKFYVSSYIYEIYIRLTVMLILENSVYQEALKLSAKLLKELLYHFFTLVSNTLVRIKWSQL